MDGPAGSEACRNRKYRNAYQVKRAISLLLCSVVFGFAGPQSAPPRPRLFLPKHTQRGDASALEWPVTVCEKMPAADLAEVYAWLKSAEWQKGSRAIPKLREAGCFAFLQPGTDRFWVVSLLEDTKGILVQIGTAAGHGFITLEKGSLRSVKDTRLAEILRRQVESYYPAGVRRIGEHFELVGEQADPRKNGQLESKAKPLPR